MIIGTVMCNVSTENTLLMSFWT